MRHLIRVAVILLLTFSCTPLFAQPLHWGNSFTPPWINGSTNGNAHNLGGSGIDGSIFIDISGGSFGPANGNNGSPTPTVGGAVYTGPGNSNLIELAPDFSNNLQNATLTITFSTAVTAVNFFVVDIDKKNANNTKYLDRVTVTGMNGATSVMPVLTKYDAVTDPDFLIINGNTATVNPANGQGGDAGSDLLDQRGTVLVNFGSSLVTSVTVKYDNAPGANNNPGSQSIGIGTIIFSPVTLPVQLSEFSGHRFGQDVVLNWKTQQEINAQSFWIERNNGNSWEKIGSITANGNSNVTSSYRYTDSNPQGNILLYRLRQNDLDNHFKYSSIIRIDGSDDNPHLLSYPNPFTAQVNISLYSGTEQNTRFTITDPLGKTVQSGYRQLFAGNNNFTITGLQSLPPAVYQVTVKDLSGNLLGQSRILKN